MATEIERIEGRIDKSVNLPVSQRTGAVAFSNAVQAMEFAKMMAIGGVSVPKHLRGEPGACLAVVIQATEWGMSPFAVANKSYSVNDRLAYESQLIQAVILKRAPIVGRFKTEYSGEGPTRRLKIWAIVREPGLPDETVDYTSPKLQDIKVKNSPLWVADPDQQLYYYSARALCRRHFPDVLLGIYAREEIEGGDPDEAIDVTPQPQPKPRTLQGRLEAIASGADPNTGEVIDRQPAEPGNRQEPRGQEAGSGGDAAGQAGSSPATTAPAAAKPKATPKPKPAAKPAPTPAPANDPDAIPESLRRNEPTTVAATAPAAAAEPAASDEQEEETEETIDPADDVLTAEQKTALKAYHDSLMRAASPQKLNAFHFDAYPETRENPDAAVLWYANTAYGRAVKELFDAHLDRIAEDVDASVSDKLLRSLIA